MISRPWSPAALVAGLLLLAVATLAGPIPPPPETRVEAVRDTLHGVVIGDPYRWLEDQQSAETRAWIEAQNAYEEQVLKDAPPAERFLPRLEKLMKIESMGVPIERGGRYFYGRRKADQELSVLCMRQGLDGPEQVLVDPHPLSDDRTTSVGILDVSDDGKLLAYSTRRGGEDEVTITFLDVDTRQELPDRFPRARYFGVQLKPDRGGLFYARHTREGPRLHEHAFGGDPASDPVIFGRDYGVEKIIGCTLSSDGRWLLVTVSHGSTGEHTEVYLRDAQAGGPFVSIVNDLDASFEARMAGDRLFLETDWKAPNHRILEVEVRDPARDRWREVVPESEHAIQGFSIAGGRLFVSYLENVVSTVRIFDLTGKQVGRIEFPTLGALGSLSGEWDEDEAFFTFTSFHIPTTIYRYQVAKRLRSVWWKAEVPIQADRFEVKQAWYASRDGTRIPMFLVHQKGLKRNGSNPTLLTGYGGFNLSQRPTFSARAAAWAEGGGVFALVNLRGGGEFGEGWHEAGMLEKKQNVFDDFIAAAEWLIGKGYTRPEKLAISGRSNGGLLVGAALTQRPDLYRAVVCGFPLLDMLRYQRFLVARYWVPEYGSSENPEQFRTLHAYSPYHRVRRGEKYPAVLFVTGDSDTRVAPLHARKMTALLQAASGSGRPVLLDYDIRFGHSGGLPVTRQIEDLATELRFLFWQLEVGPPVTASRQGGGP